MSHNGKSILGALMSPSKPDTVPWSASDLRAMLEHLLITPLVSELERFAELTMSSPERVASIIAGCGSYSFGDLLRTDSPDVRVLKLVKAYAKTAFNDQEDLPRDVARVLYVIAITRRHGAEPNHVSALDDMNVERSVRHCLTYGWLPDKVRGLLRDGR